MVNFGEFTIRFSFVGFIIETLLTIAIWKGLATTYVKASVSDQVLKESTALSLLIFRNHTDFLTWLLIPTGAMFFDIAILKQTGFSR